MQKTRQALQPKLELPERKPQPARAPEQPGSRQSPQLFYQRQLGNQTIQHLHQSGVIQAKLRIGGPNDKYEQEADRIAGQIMQMSASPIPERKEAAIQTKSLVGSITPLVQRQTTEEEEEEEEEEMVQAMFAAGPAGGFTQRQAEAEEEEAKETTLQAKSIGKQSAIIVQWQAEEDREEEEPIQAKSLAGQISSIIQRQAEDEEPEEFEEEEEEETTLQAKGKGSPGAVSSDIQSQISSSKGQGQPLPRDTQSFMEGRFGADFSDVNIHTDGTAAALNQQLHARAFTVGQDIYFAQGQYDPSSTAGKALLAHELTHTIQQNAHMQHVQRSPNKFKDDLVQRVIIIKDKKRVIVVTNKGRYVYTKGVVVNAPAGRYEVTHSGHNEEDREIKVIELNEKVKGKFRIDYKFRAARNADVPDWTQLQHTKYTLVITGSAALKPTLPSKSKKKTSFRSREKRSRQRKEGTWQGKREARRRRNDWQG